MGGICYRGVWCGGLGEALLHNPPLLFNFRKQYDCDELSLEHCPGYAARLTERGIPRLVSLFMALMVITDSIC